MFQGAQAPPPNPPACDGPFPIGQVSKKNKKIIV